METTTKTFYLIEDYFLEVDHSDAVMFEWTTASEGPADVTIASDVFYPEPFEFTLDSANPTTDRGIMATAPSGDTIVTWWEGTETADMARRQRQGTIRVVSVMSASSQSAD